MKFPADSQAEFTTLLQERIAIMDGGFGTMIQNLDLDEVAFRGDVLRDHTHDLKGNNDLLSLTNPDFIEKIHFDYFQAGSDFATTNTYSSTTIAQADYALEKQVPAMNRAAAQVANRAARAGEAATPGRRCFVLGGLGPTNRTASMSPDVNRPDYRATTFDQLAAAYHEQASALLEEGVDGFLQNEWRVLWE